VNSKATEEKVDDRKAGVWYPRIVHGHHTPYPRVIMLCLVFLSR